MLPTFDPVNKALEYAANLLDPLPDPYWDRPDLWVQDFIAFRPEEEPTFYQLEALRQLPLQKRISVRGPHGLGKTALASWAVLWFANTREKRGADWKVATTASAWRQLDKFLWPEIHKWARRLKWEALGIRPWNERTELLSLNLKLKFGAAFALASDTPSSIEGVHAQHVLYIYDEAKAIPPEIYDASEGAFSDGNAMGMANSTPGEPNGRFYDIQRQLPGLEEWWVRHVTKEEAVKAGRINEDWVEKRKKQWGEKSAIFQNRVLGEFATAEEDTVIPLRWAEMAQERWESSLDPLLSFTCVGVDVARSGSDETILAPRYHNIVTELDGHTHAETMETTGYVASILNHPERKNGYAVVDVIGVGAGVVDRLRELGYNVYAFNAGESTDAVDISGEIGFLNKRAAAWWGLRELLDPANGPTIALPPDDMLLGDLTAPKWFMTSAGRIKVESKEDIKKRLGRSTDRGDAVVMAFWEPDEQEDYYVHYDPVRISDY